MSYTKTNWQDLPNQTTPITSTRLNNMENGIANSDGAIGINEYGSSSTYAIGDYCLYNNKLYKCKVTISTAEAWTSAHWEETKMIDLTKMSLQTTTSESLEITNSAGVKGKLDIKSGKTYQETRSGKNIVDALDNVSYINCTMTDNILKTSALTNSGYGGSASCTFSNSYNIPSNSTIYISADVRLVSGTVESISVIGDKLLTRTNPSWVLRPTLSNSFQRFCYKYDVTAGNSFTGFFIQLYNCSNAVLEIKNIMFSYSNNTSYEPYGVSPSPDYPSDIRNVGDNVNIHSGGIQQGLYATATGNFDTNSNYVCSNNHIPVISGSNIVISNKMKKRGKYYVLEFDSNNNYTGYQNSNDYPEEFSLTLNNTTTSILIDLGWSTEPCTVANTGDFKVEYGEIATPYTPYNCGSIDLKVQNGNQLNPEKIVKDSNHNTIYIEDGWIRFLTGADRLIINPLETKENTAYTLKVVVKSNETTSNTIGFSAIYTDGSSEQICSTGSISDKNERTIIGTTNANKTLDYIRTIYTDYKGAFLKIEGSMLIEGSYTVSTIPDYEPHQEQTIQFPLAEGQVLHQGDYLAEDGIHQVKNTVVFNGTEDWQYSGEATTPTPRTTVELHVSSLQFKNANYKSNRFIQGNTETSNRLAYLNNFIYMSLDNTITGITSSDTNSEKLSKIKTWLSNNNVTLEYERATEVVIPYTTEQQEAYYQLQHTQMYENYTNIVCIDEIKPDIQAIYSYDNDINNYYGKLIDGLEERLHILENS